MPGMMGVSRGKPIASPSTWKRASSGSASAARTPTGRGAGAATRRSSRFPSASWHGFRPGQSCWLPRCVRRPPGQGSATPSSIWRSPFYPLNPLPAWGAVARVLGVDWGVHTLITATAVAADEVEGKSQQVGRPFFLDTGGFDGRQARTRRQIDHLQHKVRRYKRERDALPENHPKSAWYARRVQALLDEKSRCWRRYNARNRALAHLASNVILLLARVHGCSLVAIENLTTLTSPGRGKGVKGRWRQYRKNTTIRGEIWRLLTYKCALAGVRLRTVPPQHTSHTCPRCGKPATPIAPRQTAARS